MDRNDCGHSHDGGKLGESRSQAQKRGHVQGVDETRSDVFSNSQTKVTTIPPKSLIIILPKNFLFFWHVAVLFFSFFP